MTPTRTTLLGLLLAAAPHAAAQTLLDTSAAVSIQNTLLQSQPTGVPVTVPTLPSTPPVSAAPQGAAPGTPAPTPPPVLTPAQQQTLSQGREALGRGDLVQARRLFESLVAAQYLHPEGHFGLGLTLLALGDLRGAAFEFTRLRELAPGGFEAPYNLGVIASREGRFAEARRLYEEAATLARGKAGPAAERQVLEALAGEQRRAGDWAALSATLAQAAALDPSDRDLAFRLAQAQVRAGQGVEALPGLYALLSREPGRADAALLLADIYVAQNLPERAVRELDAVLPRVAKASDRASLHLRKAEILAAAGDTRGAVLAAQEATRLDPARPAAFARLGELRALRGDRAGAQAAYAQAARLAPGDAAIRTALGATRLALGLNAQARQDAAQALTLKPDAATRARALYVGGVAAYRLGDLAAARSALRQSTQAAPSADAYLWLGLTAYAQGDYAGAAGALSTSVKLDPTPTARQNLGSALLATARYAEAEAIMRGLTSEQPRNAEAWYLLGLSLRSQGREAQARPALKTAADLGHRRAAEALR